MDGETTRPTLVTSAAHLAVVKKAFSRAVSRAEKIEIAEKHKPHMLPKDIETMRQIFKNQTNPGE